jgi:methylamine dehydrogenase accessory protein MauD
MSDALLVSNALLWIVVVALTAVVAALVRQIGVLHARIAPAGALAIGRGPAVGEPAPRIEAEDVAGGTRALGGPDPAGKSTLLFFLSPTCPVCKSLLPALRSLARAERALRVVIAGDGARDEHAAFAREHDLLRFPYVLSPTLGLAFAVPKLPFAVLVGPDGTVSAKGLVNSREHLESLLEAQTRGVATLEEHVRRSGKGAA